MSQRLCYFGQSTLDCLLQPLPYFLGCANWVETRDAQNITLGTLPRGKAKPRELRLIRLNCDNGVACAKGLQLWAVHLPGTNLNARTRIFGSIWYPFFSKISRNTQRVADPAPVRGSATRGTRMNNGQLSLTLWRLSLRQPILSLVVSCFLALQFHAGLCTALSFLARSFSHLSSLVLLSRGSQRFQTFLACAFNIRCH